MKVFLIKKQISVTMLSGVLLRGGKNKVIAIEVLI